MLRETFLYIKRDVSGLAELASLGCMLGGVCVVAEPTIRTSD
jgi:hypothetical protein